MHRVHIWWLAENSSLQGKIRAVENWEVDDIPISKDYQGPETLIGVTKNETLSWSKSLDLTTSPLGIMG